MNEQTFKKRVKNYLFGGAIALTLTATAFVVVGLHVVSTTTAILLILCLAIAQAVAQMYLFLHIGEEKKPRWRNFSMLFVLMMSVILVAGSIWVMISMNYNMGMSPEQMEQYMLEQNKKGF